MTLTEIREEIDAIDLMHKDLMMRRLDCARMIADIKADSADRQVYRAEREAQILEEMAKGVPQDRLNGYLAVVRKILETSRMYQYGLYYESDPSVFAPLAADLPPYGETESVTVELTRANHPGSLAAVLSMIGDYGYDITAVEVKSGDCTEEEAGFVVTVAGNLREQNMEKLMYQLSEECRHFRILSIKTK